MTNSAKPEVQFPSFVSNCAMHNGFQQVVSFVHRSSVHAESKLAQQRNGPDPCPPKETTYQTRAVYTFGITA